MYGLIIPLCVLISYLTCNSCLYANCLIQIDLNKYVLSDSFNLQILSLRVTYHCKHHDYWSMGFFPWCFLEGIVRAQKCATVVFDCIIYQDESFRSLIWFFSSHAYSKSFSKHNCPLLRDWWLGFTKVRCLSMINDTNFNMQLEK